MIPLDVRAVATALRGVARPASRQTWMYDEADRRVVAIRAENGDLADLALGTARLCGELRGAATRVEVQGWGVLLDAPDLPAWDGPRFDWSDVENGVPPWLAERAEAWFEKHRLHRFPNAVAIESSLKDGGWERAFATSPTFVYLRDADPHEGDR